MAYSYETSSVKTINGEVSGLADVVARQAIANLPTLSAGEGIALVTEDGKTRIENNISAGTNISLVYDQETNKIRIDSEGGQGAIYSGISPIVVNNTTNQISADTWSFSAGYGLVFTDDNVNKVTKLEVEGESLSAGPNIDIFSSGGYVVISATGGAAFPMTGTDGTANYTANANFSSFTLTTGQGAAGCYVDMNAKGVHYEAYPSTDVSASWYNIINTTNNSSNCYCIRFKDGFTAADLANYSAYDKVTVVHSNEYTQDCNLYWDGNTKVFPSGLYCELVKGTNDQNQIDWFFTNSGWINNLWWDWD